MDAEHAAGQLCLVPYTIECLKKSQVWLSDPEIRELTLASPLTEEGQQRFFQSLPTRTDYAIWGVSLSHGGLIGAAGLKNHQGTIAEYWGYIGERTFWGQGLGRAMLEATERKAREMGFTELHLKVVPFNQRAIGLYLKSGYVLDAEKSPDGCLIMRKKDL